MAYKNPEDVKAYMKEYDQRPERKTKRKAYMKEYRQRPEVRAKRKVYMKEYMKEYDQKPERKANLKAYAKIANKKYRAKNRHKHRAQDKARYYIKIKKPCEVKGCKKIGHKHHEDYSKPLDVNWLCNKHHGKFHQSNLSLKSFLRKEKN